MTPQLPPDIELTRDVGVFSPDVLALQAAASMPYAAFVYDDDAQAARVNRMLFERGAAEFCAPSCEVLMERGRAVGLLVALDDVLLRRRRMSSAKALLRSGELAGHPEFAARLQHAGATLHQPRAGDWYLSRIAVAKSARGRGYGHLLLHHFLGAGRERGLRRAVLEVDPESVAAVHLYEAAGFEQLSETEVVDASGERRLRYRIMIAAL